MRVENRTEYRDADVEALVEAAFDAKRANRRKVRRVLVRRSRSDRLAAWAHMIEKEIELILPTPPCPRERRAMAQLLEHEIDHLCFGLLHPQMQFNGDWWLLRVPWASSCRLRRSSQPTSRAPRPRRSGRL